MNPDIINKKNNNFNVFENIDKTVVLLSNDISIFLAEEIEELNISSALFKKGMSRLLNKIINYVANEEKTIIILPDSIPGFTMLAIKKTNEKYKISKSNDINKKVEKDILSPVINNFFKKNEKKVLFIENNDISFVLFPIADIRKNLKDLELYITN